MYLDNFFSEAWTKVAGSTRLLKLSQVPIVGSFRCCYHITCHVSWLSFKRRHKRCIKINTLYFFQFYNRERSVCKQVTEVRTIEVLSSGQRLEVSYAESKMVIQSSIKRWYLLKVTPYRFYHLPRTGAGQTSPKLGWKVSLGVGKIFLGVQEDVAKYNLKLDET